MLFFICLFDTFWTNSFISPVSFTFSLFSPLLSCTLNFSRVAFVFSRLILIKAWQNKRDGGPENGLFDTFWTCMLDTVWNCFICVFLHWCRKVKNCQIAWDGLGAVFHTNSKTFRYARGLFGQNTREPEPQRTRTSENQNLRITRLSDFLMPNEKYWCTDDICLVKTSAIAITIIYLFDGMKRVKK